MSLEQIYNPTCNQIETVIERHGQRRTLRGVRRVGREKVGERHEVELTFQASQVGLQPLQGQTLVEVRPEGRGRWASNEMRVNDVDPAA